LNTEALRRHLTPRRIAVAAGVFALFPVLVALFRSIGLDWSPAGDWAVIEQRVRDVGTDDTPLLGPYSRYGWNHLGPMMFWLLAIPYNLTGGQSWSLLGGAALLNGVAIALAVALAWMAGRLMFATVVAVAMLVLQLWLGPTLIADPWNPWISIIPFALLIVATWSCVLRVPLALPVVAVTSSFLVQSHVGFGLMCAALAAVAVVAASFNRFGANVWRVTGTLVVIAWLPVLFDLIGGQNNLGAVFEHFGSGNENVGMMQAVDAIGNVLVIGPWAVTAIFLVLSAAVSIVCWRAGDRRSVAVIGISALTVFAGVASTSAITEEVHTWLVRWWLAIAVTWLAGIGWAITRRIRPGVWPEYVGTTLVGIAVLLAIVSLFRVSPNPPASEYGPVVERFDDAASQVVESGQVFAITGEGGEAGWISDALSLELEKSGSRRASDLVNRYGPERNTDAEVQLFVGTGDGIETFANQEGLVQIASWAPGDNAGDPVPSDIALFAPQEAVGG
jgi:hypothetical protein